MWPIDQLYIYNWGDVLELATLICSYQKLFMLGWLAGLFKMFVEGLLCSLYPSRYVETIPYVNTFCLSFTISFISISVFAC